MWVFGWLFLFAWYLITYPFRWVIAKLKGKDPNQINFKKLFRRK